MSRFSWLLGLVALSACKGEADVATFNAPPTVVINDPEDGSIYEAGEPIVFRAIVNDDGPIEDLELEWSSSADKLLESTSVPDADGVVQFETSNLSQGEHLITLRAFDPEGDLGSGSVNVVVEVVPEAPYITVVHPTDKENGVENTLFTFEVEVGDRQDPPTALIVDMKSSYDSNGDGTADTPGAGCMMIAGSDGHATCTPVTPLPRGSNLLTFSVTDTDLNVVFQNSVLNVLAREDVDVDGDGWTPRQGDCDDLNKLVYPAAPENCDGLDNDCNGSTPIDGPQTECWDDDGDGFCETGACANATGTIPDCDDANPQAYPSGVPEQPNDKDDNCNGTIDEGTAKYDDDGDGYCESPPCVNATGKTQDCNDANADVNPAESETCDAGNIDNDCDGNWNEKDAPGCTKYYQDADGDSYGAKSGTSECWCTPGHAPYTGTNNTDCLDTDANTHPGQAAYFTFKRGDNKNYDFNCDSADEKQWRGTTTGCYENLSAIICEVQDDGWQGTEKACGMSGNYLTDCGTNVDFFCILGCGNNLGCIGNCLSCTPEPENRTQACR